MVFEEKDNLSSRQQSQLPIASFDETGEYLERFTNYEDSSWVSNSEDAYKIGDTYKCEKCDYRSKHKHNVKSHNRAQHEVVKYSCNFCDYKTGYSHNLNKHNRN